MVCANVSDRVRTTGKTIGQEARTFKMPLVHDA